MGHVCSIHAGSLNPDYGSCAPLHMERNADTDRFHRYAGEAERMAAALLKYAEAHRRAAELSEVGSYAEARSHAAEGRAALHQYNVLSPIRDRT